MQPISLRKSLPGSGQTFMNATSRNRWLGVIISLVLITTLSFEGFSLTKQASKKRQHAGRSKRVLWHDPGNISQRDLYYGPGSKELAPKPPFRFVKEIKEGGNPKFDVEDARGVKWRVKLGPEAQAETVSTRLVWAMGYNAEESYYLDRANIQGLRRLSRGQKYVQGESVRGAALNLTARTSSVARTGTGQRTHSRTRVN